MSSGVAKLQIAGEGGTLQLTNCGDLWRRAAAPGQAPGERREVSLRADGSAGAPLTLELKLNAAGDKMKGMGKYEGFGVRLELRRTARKAKRRGKRPVSAHLPDESVRRQRLDVVGERFDLVGLELVLEAWHRRLSVRDLLHHLVAVLRPSRPSLGPSA